MMVAGRSITEAWGRITPATALAVAATGVDLIAIGWLTHSAPILDIGLDYRESDRRGDRRSGSSRCGPTGSRAMSPKRKEQDGNARCDFGKDRA